MIASLSRRFLKWHNLLQFIQVRFIYSLFFAVGLYYPFFSRFSFCYEVYKSPTIAVSVGLHSYTQFFCQGFSRKDGGKLAPSSFSLLVEYALKALLTLCLAAFIEGSSAKRAFLVFFFKVYLLFLVLPVLDSHTCL